MDSSILMHPKVWETTGHVANFSDETRACLSCGHGVREDSSVPLSSLKCPHCGSKGKWGEKAKFNTLFGTSVGSTTANTKQAWLRPETCQGMFTNYANVVSSSRRAVYKI